MTLEGKVALVTGAGRGIGRAIALAFAAEGACIAVNSRTQANADRVAEEITAGGGQAISVPGDVGVAADVDAVVSQTMERFGKIDILVNNAGVTRDGLLIRMSEDDWDSVLNANLRGAFLMCKAVAKPMMKARTGSIINLSSVMGLRGNAGQANYSASKAGLIGLTKSLAKELGPRNITVNAIAPGFIETDMTAELSEALREGAIKQTPLGRLGQAEDIAALAVFLASDGARFLTGQAIAVDGGMFV